MEDKKNKKLALKKNLNKNDVEEDTTVPKDENDMEETDKVDTSNLEDGTSTSSGEVSSTEGEDDIEGGDIAEEEKEKEVDPKIKQKATGLNTVISIPSFDFRFSEGRMGKFVLPKMFLPIMILYVISFISIIGIACYLYMSVIAGLEEKSTALASQSEAKQLEIDNVDKEVEDLTLAAEIKEIWTPLLERRFVISTILEKLLVTLPSDIRISSIDYKLDERNLSKFTLVVRLGIIAESGAEAIGREQDLRSDIASYFNVSLDSFNPVEEGSTVIQYQGANTKVFNFKETWEMTVDTISDSELRNIYEKLDKTHSIRLN